MKLDKMKFAKLVSFISAKCGYELDVDAIDYVDHLIDIDVQPVPSGLVDPAALHRLLGLMKEGTQKIEAIKQHRMMTGYGLKESKDVIEMYWSDSTPKLSALELKRLVGQNYGDDRREIIEEFIYKAFKQGS